MPINFESFISAAIKKAEVCSSVSDKLYQLSMPLLAAAFVKHESYATTLQTMRGFLDFTDLEKLNTSVSKNEISASIAAWMLGRIIVAAQAYGDNNTLKIGQNTLLAFLQQPTMPEDAMSGWAWAYLLATKPEEYQMYHQHLDTATANAQEHFAKDPSTLLWTLTMNLYAAAQTDKTQFQSNPYREILQQLTELTGKETVLAAIQCVPQEDYRHWLISTIRMAAFLRGDDATFAALENAWNEGIGDARYPENEMLAHAVEENIRGQQGVVEILTTDVSSSLSPMC